MSWHADARRKELRTAIVGGVPATATVPELRLPERRQPAATEPAGRDLVRVLREVAKS